MTHGPYMVGQLVRYQTERMSEPSAGRIVAVSDLSVTVHNVYGEDVVLPRTAHIRIVDPRTPVVHDTHYHSRHYVKEQWAGPQTPAERARTTEGDPMSDRKCRHPGCAVAPAGKWAKYCREHALARQSQGGANAQHRLGRTATAPAAPPPAPAAASVPASPSVSPSVPVRVPAAAAAVAPVPASALPTAPGAVHIDADLATLAVFGTALQFACSTFATLGRVAQVIREDARQGE